MFHDLTEYLLQALNCYRTISKREQLNSHPLLKCKVVYEILSLLICIDMPSWRFTYLAYSLHCKLRGPLRRENCFCWAALPQAKSLVNVLHFITRRTVALDSDASLCLLGFILGPGSGTARGSAVSHSAPWYKGDWWQSCVHCSLNNKWKLVRK